MRRSTWLALGATGVDGIVVARTVTRPAAPPAGPAHSLTVFRSPDYVAANLPPERRGRRAA